MAQVLVNIDVPDIEEGVRFYTEGLALCLGRRLGDDFVELLGAEAPIYLLLKPERSTPFTGASAQRSYSRHWSPIHLDFVVEDIEKAVLKATGAGARLERGITEHAYGRLALLSDPFGHGFCLLQFQGSGYEAIRQKP